MTATQTDLDELLDALLERARSRPAPPLVNLAGEEVGALATTGRIQVNSGDTILASWGNTVFDQTVECFASPTDRDSQWNAPHDGAACYTADQGIFWLRKQGAWVALGGPSVAVGSGSGLTSFTDGAGEVWVAAGSVLAGAWRKARDVLHAAYTRSVAWTLPQAWTALGMDNRLNDPYALYNPSTGVFTAPIAGLWGLFIAVGASADTAGRAVQAAIGPTLGTNLGAGIASSGGAAIITASSLVTAKLTAGQTLITQNFCAAALAGWANAGTRAQFDYLGTG